MSIYQDLRGYLIYSVINWLVDLETGCDWVYKEIPLDQLQQAPLLSTVNNIVINMTALRHDPYKTLYITYVDRMK